MSIQVFYDETNFRIKSWRKLKCTIDQIILKENKICNSISFVITNDDALRKINVQFLEHDYYTDVITFDYNSGNVVNGEVYISLDTVRRNSNNYKVSLDNEVKRVAIHGVLHLAGYDDKTTEQKRVMKRMEDFWLAYNEK